MKLLRSYRVLRFTLVLMAILAQCVALSSFSLLVIAGTLAALSWYVTEGPRGRSIPPWVARLLVFVVILFSIIDAFGPVTQLPLVLGRFVVWLTVIKLYGRRTIDNEAQLLLLSLLLMAVGGLYATDFVFGILLILWTALAAWVLLLYQLHHGMESMRIERYRAVPVEHPTPWTRPVTGLHVQRVFRRTGLFILLIGVVCSIVFFLVIPRETIGMIPSLSIARDAGSDRMELKPDRNIEISNRQVMSVSLFDSSGSPVRLSSGIRLRGTVLDQYKGRGVWETGSRMYSTVNTTKEKMTPLIMTGVSQPSHTMDVTLHQKVKRIYSLYRPVGIETDPATRIVMNLSNGTLGLGLGAPAINKYRLEVDLEQIVTSPISRRVNLYQNDDVKALTMRVLLDNMIDPQTVTDSPETIIDAADAIESYLHSDAFTYATDGSEFSAEQRISLENDADPIALFLLQHKRGHCEFFAASMVSMCDTLGIPARIVTGYYVDRWDAVGNSYIVLERDAHAWVEIETEPQAWMPFDPTPASEGAPTWQQPMTFVQSIRFAWQRWEMGWQANVIGFDAAAQKKLLDITDPYWKSHFNSAWTYVNNKFDYVVGWFDIGAGGRLWINLVAGAFGLSICTVLIVMWRKRSTKKLLCLSQHLDEHVPVTSIEFYARLQRVFMNKGWSRPRFIPAQTWIQSLALDEDTDVIANHLTETYYAIRYGGLRPSRSQRLELNKSVHQLEMLLRTGS